MASVSETGHAKNVANFSTLIHILYGMGNRYDPFMEPIKLLNLQNQKTALEGAIREVTAQKAAYDLAVNERSIVYDKLPKLITRISGMLQAGSVHPKTMDDAAGYISKLRGGRRKPAKSNGDAVKPDSPDAVPVARASVSQHSYDQQFESFSKLNALIQLESQYQTNDAELSKTALDQLLITLREKNEAVATQSRNLREARLTRDKALYDATSGMIVTVKMVKGYLKSMPDATDNPDYKKAVGSKFMSPPANYRID